ncbi:MAG TPA: hypothetical protein PLS93_11770 [Accumulibacter sp.]|nr:hypothetical protein [Accumulibacter sp.]
MRNFLAVQPVAQAPPAVKARLFPMIQATTRAPSLVMRWHTTELCRELARFSSALTVLSPSCVSDASQALLPIRVA